MLRINELKLPITHNEKDIRNKIVKLLRCDVPFDYKIVRKSLDARKKPELFFSYIIDIIVDDEDKILKRADKKILKINNIEYAFPHHIDEIEDDSRPVIIGLGPCGLFAGLYLARNGFKPILVERGKKIDERTHDVNRFWEEDTLNENSNVQFGEGGAGAFSDGKLNTLVKDKYGRNKAVLKDLVSFGAPEEILYDYKPHIGTDRLKTTVKNISNEILKLGGEIFYDTLIDEFEIKENVLKKISSSKSNISFKSNPVILAIGHSARDTFKILFDNGLYMAPKPFAIGFRVQHKTSLINESQYGVSFSDTLGNAPYKVTYTCKDQRGVYSFCMCPGGYVVNASSAKNMLAVNGMSYYDRNSPYSNSAIIVTINPEDYGDGKNPMSGIEFQKKLEKKAYDIGNGHIPYEFYSEFKENRLYLDDLDDNLIGTKGKCEHSCVHKIMPQFINDDFVEGMEAFGTKIKGFDSPDTLIFGIESRTSSPVKISRDEFCESNIQNLFVAGEGAGYAGGISSAAMDGILIAEKVAERILGKE